MRMDAYTKTLLTIIALCLMWLCVRDTSLLSTAHARPAVQEVKIVGIDLGNKMHLLPISLREILVEDPDAPPSQPRTIRWVPIGGTATYEKTP
jgi:hypothetical protein